MHSLFGIQVYDLVLRRNEKQAILSNERAITGQLVIEAMPIIESANKSNCDIPSSDYINFILLYL